jgi:hypothetical protein
MPPHFLQAGASVGALNHHTFDILDTFLLGLSTRPRFGSAGEVSNFGRDLNWIRSKRTISGAFDLGLNLQTTVYLGLFNGKEYIIDRISELQKQDSQDFYLLIVDNFSDSFDMDFVSSLLQSSDLFSNRFMVVRNPVNLGGLGSFQLNLDLVPSSWLTFVHQDDSYLTNHVSSHLNAINEGLDSVTSVSSDLGSLSARGRFTSVPPRSNWFIQNSYPEEAFIANVSEQIIPFPALSVNKSMLEPDIIPWHTVAFSDSELTLFMLMTGSHSFIEKETVLYRENPDSESHSQGQAAIAFSATLGLLRVFSSQEFERFVSKVQEIHRVQFLGDLKNSVSKRIRNKTYQELVWAMVLERITHAWAYRQSESTAATRNIFIGLGESYTPLLLSGISKFASPEADTPSSLERPDGITEFSAPTSTRIESKSLAKKIASLLKAIVFFGIGFLPYSARKIVHQRIRSFAVKFERLFGGDR